MALPSYLVRRDGGRYHVQMRLGTAMARSLESSHLRFSLRTSDGRQARRRLVECLEWAYAFKEAPDLEAAGAAIARSLVKAVVGGPPDLDQLPGRLILEDYATDFIRRSRERDFAWVAKLPTFADLLKTFTAQNAALENYTRREPQVAVAPPEMPADLRSIVVPGIEPQLGSSPSRVEQLLESVLERLDDRAHPQASVVHGTDPNVADHPSRTDLAIESVRISTAVTRFLDAEAKRTATRKGDALYGPILHFMQDFCADCRLSDLTAEVLAALEGALPNIPGLKGCPLALRKSLHARYELAREKGWGDLARISETTLDLRYRRAIRVFFKWAVEAKLYLAPAPKFTAKSDEVFAALPRDSLQDDEIIRFVSAPLFTGCDGPRRIWVPGAYLVQNDLYWIFLILLLTGMRTGEPPQIRLDDILHLDEATDTGGVLRIYFFDMRPYDPAKGRKPLKDLKHLKRADFARVIPIHPLLIDLGLLGRAERLRKVGAVRLFPDLKPHVSRHDEVRWGKSTSRAFAYARKLPGIDLGCANICLYSTRQLMADWLDTFKAPQRVRNRVLGHVNDENAADGYGGKGLMPAAQAPCITELEPPVIREMRKVLMAALTKVSEGKLTHIEPIGRRPVVKKMGHPTAA